MKNVALVSCLLSLVLSAAGAGSADRKSVFVNYDGTHYAHSRTLNGIVPDEAEIRGLVRQYKGTDVTDLLFCIGGRLADVSNGAKQSWCDKYHQTKENGRQVCYTNHYIALYRELEEVRKLDRYALWCDEARKIGIHPWLSFRLNDCHDNHKPTSILHPDFFHEHPECRRIRHREPRGYFDRCFDFDCAAVRERELKFIAEMLERYDPDGVELDWQREIYCFQPGRENAETLTAFTRQVRALADAAAKRRGHPVKVMARVPAEPETALRFGFDVAAWADEKLVDVLVPCPRWHTTDNEIPTDLWKRLLRGSGVTLAPGIEIRICGVQRAFYMLTDQLVGATAWHYSAGADGIYFFNYFDDPGWKKPETQYWRGFAQPLETMGVWWGNQLKWLKFIGHADAVLAAPRDHMLTFRDIEPLWEDVRFPFQTTVRKGQVKFFRLATGVVPPERELTLRIGVIGGVPPKRVFVNSRPCAYLRNEPCVPAFTDAPLCCYRVPALAENAAVVEIVADAEAELTHLDLQVRHRSATARPAPRPALLERIKAGIEVYGIVHWGLNTYTDREWGYGDEDPKLLAPDAFDADQIVGACRDGGLQGLIVVAKHHDGFCLWPTKTTEHNIAKSPFRGGKGDYVKEMERACRRHGLRFGVYCSPWDRNNAAYATPKYVETFHAQIRELLSGEYGEVFEMWFDGANGGDGWYGGARERRQIPLDYYRFGEVFGFVRELQPKVCIFNEHDGADYRWPGNERGELGDDSSATIRPWNPAIYTAYCNRGDLKDGTTFHPPECDFPLRRGWFYHASESNTVRCGEFLMQRYLNTVGNGGTMNIGIAPDRHGRLAPEDVAALKRFGELKKEFFARPADGEALCNVVVMTEDVSRGECVAGWKLTDGQTTLASGTALGVKRIRVLGKPAVAKDVGRNLKVDIGFGGERERGHAVRVKLYHVEPKTLNRVMNATTTNGETDTAQWMTGK